MLDAELTVKFRRDYKRLKKRGYDMSKLDNVVDMLRRRIVLPPKYYDHLLVGDRTGYRECHIKGDWLLVYKVEERRLVLVLSETGTHADILE